MNKERHDQAGSKLQEKIIEGWRVFSLYEIEKKEVGAEENGFEKMTSENESVSGKAEHSKEQPSGT